MPVCHSGHAREGANMLLRPSMLFAAALALGAATVAGFAPLQASFVPFFTLAGLFVLVRQAPSPRIGALAGFGFGLGLFGVGVSWIFISLQRYSGLSDALSVAATVLFCAFFALYPALFGYLAARWRESANTLLLFPCLWTVTEIGRGAMLGGFSWLSLGYSQVPHSLLRGYAPLAGQYGVSFLVALLSACIAGFMLRDRNRIAGPLLAVVVCSGGWWLQDVQWTEQQGAPVSVSLLQGNVSQDRKWRQSEVDNTLNTYLELTRQASSRLIVMPETALPMPSGDIPLAYREALLAAAKQHNADIVVGAPERVADDEGKARYYNSAKIWGASPLQTYRKARLVPFGEFMPRLPFVERIVTALSIPLSDLSAGAVDQAPLQAGGARLAINICFENIFGEATARSAADAEALVNMSNLAWFGQSLAPAQFLQMAQMRALEAGRYVMLATNTGPTAVVDHRGHVRAQAPAFTATVLAASFVRRTGVTLYSRIGEQGLLLLLGGVTLLVFLSRPAISVGPARGGLATGHASKCHSIEP